MSLVGEARIGGRDCDGLVRQAEHGGPEALPHPQPGGRHSGEIFDQSPQAGRTQPDTGGELVDAASGREIPKRSCDAGVDCFLQR